MKGILLSVLMIIAVFGFISMTHAIHEVIPSETQVPEPGPDAEKLNEYIIKYNPYRAWALWPDKGRLYKGKAPHGALLTTFVNPAAYDSIKRKRGMADGSIIVMENYTADKKFIELTVMYKIKGYHPAEGDWFWAKYRPDGSVEASGKLESCIKCHGQRKENDYIMTEDIMK